MGNYTIDDVPAFIYFADTKDKILDRIEYLRSRGLVGILNITEEKVRDLPDNAQRIIKSACQNRNIEFFDEDSEAIFYDEVVMDIVLSWDLMVICEMEHGETISIHLMIYGNDD